MTVVLEKSTSHLPLVDAQKTDRQVKSSVKEWTNSTKSLNCPESPRCNGRENFVETASSRRKEAVSSWELDYFLPPTPDVIPLEVGQRLVAIGDIHGRLRHLRRCLRAGGIIGNHNEDWIAGNTICIQLGDVLDRGYAEEKCLLLLTKLARQAQKVGGALIMLWGNHEAENVRGRSIVEFDSQAFEAQFTPILNELKDTNWRARYGKVNQARWAALEPGGPLAAPLLSKLKIAVKVGRTVLVHGGLTTGHLNCYGGIPGMNEAAAHWILKTPYGVSAIERTRAIEWTKPGFFASGGLSSPLWTREYSHPPDKELPDSASEKVNAVLVELESDRLVVGHTVQSKINSALNGKIWRIDIGSGVTPDQSTDPCLFRRGVAGEALQVVRLENGDEQVSILKKNGS